MYRPRMARTAVTLTAWLRSLISGLTSTLKCVSNDKKVSLCAWSPFCGPSVYKGKGKGHPRTGHEGPEVQQMYSSTISLTSALDVGGWSTPRPGHFAPGKIPYPFYRRLGGPQGRSRRVRKISPPPGFDPRTVKPVASRYTD